MCNAVNSTRDRRTRKRTRTLRLHISRRYYRPRCRVYFFFFPSLLPSPSSPFPSLPSLHPSLTCRRFDSWRQSGNVEGTWGQIRASLSRIGRIRRQKLRSTFDLFEENRNVRTAKWYHGLLFLSFAGLFDCKTRRGTVGKKRDRDGGRFKIDRN